MPDTESLAASTPAWLLTANEDFKIALGESQMAEYLRDAALSLIPNAVDYCNQVVFWRDSFIPVLDLNVILGDEELGNEHIVVVVYQEYEGQQPQHLAIKVLGEIERVDVVDDTACDWTDDYPIEIQPVVESLFINEKDLISVINLADLCNDGYRDYLMQLEENKAGL